MSIKFKSGDVATDFLLMGDDGKEYSLKSFKKIVLYFYPKDNTPGCTKEAVGFSELIDKFSSENVAVMGISPDSIASHKKFKEKHNLKVILLSDPDKKVAEAYGAYGEKVMYGKKTMGIIRSTFIIEEGIVIDAFYNVKVDGHCEMVYNRIR